jgi:hypothetical protein
MRDRRLDTSDQNRWKQGKDHPSCKLILRTIDSDKLIIIYRINKQFHLQNEFNYSSPYWTNKETYAVEDGLESLSEKQTKLASYWNTPFNKICLGMKVNGATKWILIGHQASSLFNVIAGGNFIATTIEKNAWKSLVKDSYLQKNCNQQGFNIDNGNIYDAFASNKVRIGLVANNQNDCKSCNSCIGFGTSVRGCHGDVRNSACGNIMAFCPDPKNNKDTAAFGYILVQ